jgi:DNA-binding XRE family transcriptional regulator
MQFSQYIQQSRRKHQLTQSELAEQMASRFAELSELDSNTISRWERGQHTPAIDRQRLCVEFFGDNPVEKLPFHLAQTTAVTPAQNLARQRLLKQLSQQRFNTLVGGLPAFSSDSQLERCHHGSEEAAYIEFISALRNRLRPEQMPLTTAVIVDWLQHPSAYLWLLKHQSHPLLHCLFVHLKPAVYQQLLYQQREESTLTADDLASPDETSCLYIISLYSTGNEALVDLYLHLYQHCFQHRGRLQSLGMLATHNDDVKLGRHLAMQVKQTSPALAHGGVQYLTKRYSWATLTGHISQLLLMPATRLSIQTDTNS